MFENTNKPPIWCRAYILEYSAVNTYGIYIYAHGCQIKLLCDETIRPTNSCQKKGVKVASSNKVKKNETLTKIAFPSPFFFFLFGYLNKKGNICAPNKQLRIIWVAKK